MIIRASYKSSLIVAATAALFFCVVVPLQTFLGNSTAFDYGLGRLVVELAVLWLIATTLLSIVLHYIGRALGALPHALLLAFVVYEYLATGVMTIGFPTLDGEVSFYGNVTRRVIDCAVGGGLAIVAFVFARKIAPYFRWICVALVVLMGASLCDVNTKMLPEAEELTGPFASGYAPKISVAKSAYFSSHRNVMVFVLDSLTPELMCDVFANEPDIATKFDGFTVCRDHFGMMANTTFAVPGMLTGRLYDGCETFGDYISRCFSKESALYEYVKSDIPTFALLGCFSRFGYTSNPPKALAEPDPKKGSPKRKMLCSVFVSRIAGQQAWNLFEIVRFRLTPFIGKGFVLCRTMRNWDAFKDIDSESALYPILETSMIRDDVPVTFHFYHTGGCHVPYTTDRNGKSCAESFGYRGAYEESVFVLKRLGLLFDHFRKCGIYDTSSIIVTADHGNYDPKQTSIGGVDLKTSPVVNRAFPCMAIKGRSDKGNISFYNDPTSHTRLYTLLSSLAKKDLSRTHILSLLKTNEPRVFRENISGRWIDWCYNDDKSIVRRDYIPHINISSLSPIKLGKNYSLRNSDLNAKVDIPPLIYEGIDGSCVTAPLCRAKTMSIKFRVPNAERSYNVRLGFATYEGNPTEIKIEGEECIIQGKSEINVKVQNIRPDEEGCATVRLLRKTIDGDLYITSFAVE